MLLTSPLQTVVEFNIINIFFFDNIHPFLDKNKMTEDERVTIMVQ